MQQEELYGYPLMRNVELQCFELKQNITASVVCDNLISNVDSFIDRNALRERIYKCLLKLENLKIIHHTEEATKFKTRRYIFKLSNNGSQD